MSPQSAPEHKQPIYRLPEVPEYRHRKFAGGAFYRAVYTLICLAAVLVVVWGVIRGATTVVGIVSPKATKTIVRPTPTRLPVHLSPEEANILQAACPDTGLLAAPSLAPTQPTLDFCAPKYYGNVTGPVGSHLTLIAEGISRQPEKWALVNDVEKPTLNDVNSLQACFQREGMCFHLSLPKTNHQPVFSLYSWIWLPPQFPTGPANYYVVAFNTGSSQLLWSSISFTLNSSLAPCISISVVKDTKTNSGDCTHKSDFSLAPGANITIHGSNWILKDLYGQQRLPIFVQVAISCKAHAKCAPSTLPILSANVDVDGTFNLSYQLPEPILGTYTVTASCQVPQIATPGLSPTASTNTNTMATGALTFGGIDDATKLTLHIRTNLPSTPPGN